MKQYLDLLADVVENGKSKGDRTGTGTRSVFGRQTRFNLNESFPLLTTKKLYLKGIIHELLWILRGETNIRALVEQNVHIWTDWPHKRYVKKTGDEISLELFGQRILDDRKFATEWGELGPVYGKQWRAWESRKGAVDQVAELVRTLRTNPDSRRHVVSAWNAGDLQEVSDLSLAWCHCFFQADVTDGRLSVQLYQRSADIFLGVPFNIASYALLTMMLAQVCDLELGDFVHTFGDLHLYNNHVEQAHKQLKREPRPAPRMLLNPERREIDDFVFEDFTLEGYDPHPAIKAPVAV